MIINLFYRTIIMKDTLQIFIMTVFPKSAIKINWETCLQLARFQFIR